MWCAPVLRHLGTAPRAVAKAAEDSGSSAAVNRWVSFHVEQGRGGEHSSWRPRHACLRGSASERHLWLRHMRTVLRDGRATSREGSHPAHVIGLMLRADRGGTGFDMEALCESRCASGRIDMSGRVPVLDESHVDGSGRRPWPRGGCARRPTGKPTWMPAEPMTGPMWMRARHVTGGCRSLS